MGIGHNKVNEAFRERVTGVAVVPVLGPVLARLFGSFA